ncbi:hypothetical protein MUN74_14390 [Agromyces endophyticus]|uniref:hypothetical protein n=1 Tax=Agromyces sp. H17E-10 TaxID=2932244 RepID=UPI001FD1A5A1|nr:hypothetical protein [Agromyces sp. H17E-10]UOQ88454.1 hypothetical protein MUN74_14390 [Agromyces sp. H17E-10]
MTDEGEPRQRVERASGRARRAKLTPAPGSDPSPEAPVARDDDDASGMPRPTSSDDERLLKDLPPHWRRD